MLIPFSCISILAVLRSRLFVREATSEAEVYGKTDEQGSKIVENTVKVQDFNATIGYALGLPLDQVLYSPSMSPFTLADKGRPVVALFG